MDLFKKSVSVLKNLQLKNGGILATPVKGVYPYVYPRDAVIMTKALNRSGENKRSQRFYYFIKDRARIDHYKEIMHRYTPEGLPAVTRKHQHDNMALIVHGIYDTYVHGRNKRFIVDMWPVVQSCIENLLRIKKNGLIHTNSSIHESDELEKGYELWANCCSVRALFDASKIAGKLLCRRESNKWKEEGDKLFKEIRKRMFDKKEGIYIKNVRRKNISDISLLAPFYFEIDDSKKILKSTLKNLRENIWVEGIGGYRRFKRREVVKEWHWYTGGSGGWVALTLMAARFFERIGDKKHLKECMDFVYEISKQTKGLLPEHVASLQEYEEWKEHELEFNNRIIRGMKETEALNRKMGGDKVYWATPLGWSHAEYVLLKKER